MNAFIVFLFTLIPYAFAVTYQICINNVDYYVYPTSVTENCGNHGYRPSEVSLLAEITTTQTVVGWSVSSVTTTTELIPTSFTPLLSGGPQCDFTYPVWCDGITTVTLSNVYVTEYIPYVTVTQDVASITTSTETSEVTVTASYCQGSDGVVTRYTSGPIAGTSTITSCVSL